MATPPCCVRVASILGVSTPTASFAGWISTATRNRRRPPMLRKSIVLLLAFATVARAQNVKPLSFPDHKHRTCHHDVIADSLRASLGADLYTFRSPRHWMMIAYDSDGTTRSLTEGTVVKTGKRD